MAAYQGTFTAACFFLGTFLLLGLPTALSKDIAVFLTKRKATQPEVICAKKQSRDNQWFSTSLGSAVGSASVS